MTDQKKFVPYLANKDVVSAIYDAMISDMENQSAKLIEKYNKFNIVERDAVDSFLVYLCGYRFKTLYNQSEKFVDEFSVCDVAGHVA